MNQEENQRFTDFCEKEITLRMRWMDKHFELVQSCLKTSHEPKNLTVDDIQKSVMKAGMTAATLSNIARGYNNMKRAPPAPIPGIKYLRKTHTLASTGLGDPQTDPRLARPDSDLSPDPIMRPVDPNTTKLLNESSKEYFKKRNKVSPEEKYYFPMASNWDYGWRLQDNKFASAPEYGRCVVLKPDRVGPTPDPAYYTKPQEYSSSVCNI